jgi:putative ABC transport system permease protein
LGLVIAYPFVNQLMGRWIEENMGGFFPYFRVEPLTAVVAFALALGLAILASALPAWRASKLGVVDALRRIA